MSGKIRLTREDLFNPTVDDVVAQQEALLRPLGEAEPSSLWRRILFSSLFFMSVAGLIGGLAGWAIVEPFFNETISVWGKIEYVKTGADDDEWPGLNEAGLRTKISVRGRQFFVVPGCTVVDGRGDYAAVKSIDTLKEGQPVHVKAMMLSDVPPIVFAERIVVRPIPEGRDQEPLQDLSETRSSNLLSGVFCFAICGACVAGLVGAADGIMSRNLRRGLLSGLVGVGIAAAGGLVGLIPAGIVFNLTQTLVTATVPEGTVLWTSSTLTGGPLMVLIVGRSLAWGVFGLSLGLGHGVALRSKKLVLNGLLGGLLGALLGGMFFEPIIKFFGSADLGAGAAMSRAFGFGVIGLAVGFMIGLVEHLSKEAWLMMRAGPLAGKQFIIYKSPTILGSSPKCEIYLFKDPDVEPRHASIRTVGNRHEIQDNNTPAGTIVNGRKARMQPLKDGDQIVLGQTVLEYSERSRDNA